MKSSATTQGARTAAPAAAATQRHGAKPRGTRPERAPTKKRGAAPPRHQKQRAVPSAEMSLLKRSRTVETALNLFEPSPTTKPKRRRAHKARDVSDDVELGPRRRL